MAKSFIKGNTAINMTMVGFGQAGSRMVDEFAAYNGADGQPIYNCLALNSNQGDLDGLKYVPLENRVSLELGGLGKNPEKALRILNEREDIKEQLNNFIKDKIRAEDEFVMFFAGLGGGTGTATIVQAIEEFDKYHNKPLIRAEVEKLKSTLSADEIKKNPKKIVKMALDRAKEKFKKIGIIVTLPVRSDGPDTLRQVNQFAQKIWKLAKDKTKGVAFVTFADNQHFYDSFNKITQNERSGISNYRDYGNKEIAEIIHELNTASTQGGASVVLDSQDFRRVLTEHEGSLVLSKIEKPIKLINNSDDIINQFKKNFEGCNLHDPIQLVQKDGAKQVHHIGILTVIDGTNEFSGGAFLDETTSYLHQKLPINGTVFSGYVNTKNDFKLTTYSFYKVDGLPERLEKGLVEEYEEFKQKNNKFKFEETTIKSIDNEDNDLDLDGLNLEDLAIDDLLGDIDNEQNVEEKNEDYPSTDDIMKNLSFIEE